MFFWNLFQEVFHSLKLTASLLLKIGRNPIGKSYSNHPFSGGGYVSFREAKPSGLGLEKCPPARRLTRMGCCLPWCAHWNVVIHKSWDLDKRSGERKFPWVELMNWCCLIPKQKQLLVIWPLINSSTQKKRGVILPTKGGMNLSPI